MVATFNNYLFGYRNGEWVGMNTQVEKMAFLISAYTEPRSLRALVLKLNEMFNADFFIHIDKKVKIEPFQIDLINLPNVFFVKDRVRVYWGGYSQVEMQKAMIQEMLQRNIRYMRVVSLTGTDYPVANAESILKKMEKKEIEYIIGFDVDHEINPGKRKMSLKYSCFYLMDTHRFIRAALIRLRIPRLYYKKMKMPIYHGSEYWALTYECISELYHNYLKNEQLQKLLRYSFVPSEAWIHTMFFNSKWKDRAVQPLKNENPDLIRLSPITYFNYTSSIKILDESDYQDIMKSERLFARKIITGKSDGLISMLADHERNN